MLHQDTYTIGQAYELNAEKLFQFLTDDNAACQQMLIEGIGAAITSIINE